VKDEREKMKEEIPIAIGRKRKDERGKKKSSAKRNEFYISVRQISFFIVNDPKFRCFDNTSLKIQKQYCDKITKK
jgi:hypothetical protein